MPWLEVSLRVTEATAADAEAAMERLGALAVTLEDAADDPVLPLLKKPWEKRSA